MGVRDALARALGRGADELLLIRLAADVPRSPARTKGAAILAESNRGNPWEWGVFEQRGQFGEPVTIQSPTSIAAKVPSAKAGPATFHHSHPHRVERDGVVIPFPLSTADIGPQPMRAIWSHEPHGGAGYAQFKPEHRQVGGKAMEAAFRGLDRDTPVDIAGLPDRAYIDLPDTWIEVNPAVTVDDLALGIAAKRVGLLSRYGYDPGSDAHRATLRAMAPEVRRRAGLAERAMHAPVHGLPYPFTWGRITGAGLGVTGAGGAIMAARAAARER